MIERLKQEMTRMNINALELSVRANVGRSFVYDLLSGKSSNPTTKKMSTIANILGVSLPYLISGVRDDIDARSNSEYTSIPFFLHSDNSDNAEKVIRNAQLFQKSWIKETLATSPEDLRIIVIHNNGGLNPILNKHDTALVDISCKEPTKPGVFILQSGGSLIARHLEFVPDKNLRSVSISTDNTRNSACAHICDIHDINIIGRVVWVGREM